MVILFQIFVKKQTFSVNFNNFYFYMHTYNSRLPPFILKQARDFIAFVLQIRIYYQ